MRTSPSHPFLAKSRDQFHNAMPSKMSMVYSPNRRHLEQIPAFAGMTGLGDTLSKTGSGNTFPKGNTFSKRLVLGLVALFCFFFALPVAAAQAGLVAEAPVYDFGTVLEDTVLEHDFVIRNDSSRPLSIEKFRIGCSCTEVLTYDREIAPGGRGLIRVSFATNGYGGQAIDKPFGVVTNDPDNPEIQLTIKGKVDLFADIQPRLVKLEGVAGDPVVETVVIAPKPEYRFSIKDIHLKYGRDVTCRMLQGSGGNGDPIKLEIAATRQKAGRFFDTVTLTTDNALKPEIKIRVFGYLRQG